MKRLERRKRRLDSSLSQVDNKVIKNLISLGPRCANCQVPAKAFRSTVDFDRHCQCCRFYPSKLCESCYAGVKCLNLTESHYQEVSHPDIARRTANTSLMDIKPSMVSLATPLPLESPSTIPPATPERDDRNNNNMSQVKQEATQVVSVKKENPFKSPMATPSPAKKRSARGAKSTPDPKQRKLLEFFTFTPSPRTPKKEVVSVPDEDSPRKEFPVATVRNLSSKLDSAEVSVAEIGNVGKEKGTLVDKEPDAAKVIEPVLEPREEEVMLDLQALPNSMETEVGDFTADVAKEAAKLDDGEADGDSDLFIDADEAEETRFSEGEEDDENEEKREECFDQEDEALFQRVDTGSLPDLSGGQNCFEANEIDVAKELEKFAKQEKSKAAWSNLFTKQKEKVTAVKVEATVQLTAVKKLSNGQYRRRPDYKVLRGTRIAVDCFDFGDQHADVDYYFLSHFHYDHYQGLSKAWTKPIYCSRVTGNLVINKVRVPAHLVVKLDMDRSTDVVRHCGGMSDFKVRLLDANHCPGAVLFLFQFRDGRTILHTGDFRADVKMESYNEFWNVQIDHLYLDTTYMSPEYDFPHQDEAVNAICNRCQKDLESNRGTLFVCGSYTIGKERVWVALAQRLGLKVWLHGDRRSNVKWLEDEQLNATLGRVIQDCRVHVVPMAYLNSKKLKDYVASLKNGKYSNVVGIKPTGWTFKGGMTTSQSIVSTLHKDKTGVTIYGVPYSEHSSYSELRRFVKFFCPKSVIATVGNWKDRKQFETIAMDWVKESKLKQGVRAKKS